MKKTGLLVSAALAASILTGCIKFSQSERVFSITTGDDISVVVDTSDGYDITSESPFHITLDGENVTLGEFLTTESYETYAADVSANENINELSSGEKDGNEYIFYCQDNSQWNYIVKIPNSNSGILLTNEISQESASTAFEKMTISLSEE